MRPARGRRRQSQRRPTHCKVRDALGLVGRHGAASLPMQMSILTTCWHLVLGGWAHTRTDQPVPVRLAYADVGGAPYVPDRQGPVVMRAPGHERKSVGGAP